MAPIIRSDRIAIAIGLLCLGMAGGVVAQGSGSAATASTPGSTAMTPSGTGRTATGDVANTLRGASADRAFFEKAAKGGMAEVELGQVARQKATRDDVKQFAQRMVQDHTKANDELKSIAGTQNVTLPTALERKHQQALQKLQGLTAGAAFDRQYMSQMVADHKETVALFKTQARSGRNPEAKAFAAKQLPTLEEHLQMAQDMAKNGKGVAMGQGSGKPKNP